MSRHSHHFMCVLLSVFLFAPGLVNAGNGDNRTTAMSRESGIKHLPGGNEPVFSAALKGNIQDRVEKGVTTGIVVGVVTPQGTSFFSCGVKSFETGEPVDEHTLFEIGSNTKTFTGLLLADAIVNGRLSLDTPLQELLPAGITAPSRNGQTIKLVHLANHTSSLPPVPGNFVRVDRENPYAHYDETLLYEDLDGFELPFDIGTKTVYSNYGMGLLGTVLAANAQTTFEDLVIQTITDPLGMEDTRMTLTPDQKSRLAKGHNVGIEVSRYEFQALAGAGALLSTAEDMLKYLAANAGIKASELSPAMELAQAPSGGAFGDMTVGLGWITQSVAGKEIIWHDGGTLGSLSFMGFLKGGQMGVVVLTNSSSMPDDIGFHLLNPDAALETPKPSIGMVLHQFIENQGPSAAAARYAELRSEKADDYNFDERQLHRLGYLYMGRKRVEDAVAVLGINAEAYPESWGAHDSYAEALLANGMQEEAIAHYRRSVELNPDNQAGIKVLQELGVEIR